MRDWLNPDWGNATKVHDWRNHVPLEIRSIWETFTMDQRQSLFKWAYDLASREEWE